MALNRFEKVAGRAFRDHARKLLAISWEDFPDAAPCSARVRFYRHECSAVSGRTRSIALQECVVTSQEILVTWDGDRLLVLSAAEAESLVASGKPVETEVILAGKFTFTWKHGMCDRCRLMVLSREGSFRDARPRPALTQDDLASLTGGAVRKLVAREVAD